MKIHVNTSRTRTAVRKGNVTKNVIMQAKHFITLSKTHAPFPQYANIDV